MNTFEKMLNSVLTYLSKFGTKLIDTIGSFIILYIIYKIVCKIFRSVFSKKVFNARLEKGHADTIESLVLSMIKYSFITIVVLLFIQNFVGAVGITISSIIGVALGFASQSVIKDLFNGIFITFENQFTVGDYITINKGNDNFSGIVDSVQARTTKLRDFNGDYHIIPNGFINQVTNHSRKDSRVLVDIKVDSRQKSQDISKIINDSLEKFSHKDLTIKPYIYGVIDINELSTTYRIIGYAKPLSHWTIENELRRKIIDDLLDKNITLPVNRYSIVSK